MSCVWTVLVCMGAFTALALGKAADGAGALLGAGKSAIGLAVTLCGAMTVWGGLMEVLRRCGDMEKLGRALKRLLRPLLRVQITDEAWSDMGMNLSCNLLGLGNAATPFGVKAAQRLASEGSEGLRALTWLLVLNDSALELLPTTIIALRREAGSQAPGDIWLPTLLATAAATVCAVLLMLLLEGRDRRRGRIEHVPAGAVRGHRRAGRSEGRRI